MKKILAPLFWGIASVVSLSAATLTGLWEFDDNTDLGKATVGSDLVFSGVLPTFAATVADDSSSSLTGVMVTQNGINSNRIQVTHGIAANGGGSLVNQYSIVTDIFTPVASRSSWRAIVQTDAANSDDADYFLRSSSDTVGVAAMGYTTNPIDETVWTRLVLTVDLTLATDELKFETYFDGVNQANPSASPELLDDRFSLSPTMFIFTDNSGDGAPMNVGAFAIYDGVLTPAEVLALGSAGDVIAVPEPSSSVLLGLSGLALILCRRR